MNQNNLSCQGPMKPMDRDKQCVLNRPPMMDNMNPNNFPGVSQLTLTGTKVPTENLTPQQRQHREEQLAHINRMKQMLFPENQTQSTDEFGNQRMVPGGNANVTQNPDDLNRNNSGDSNDMKSQIGLKSVNNNSNNMNSPMGRNMNGQSGNNGPMESPMGFNNMVNPLVNPNNNSNNNSSSNNTSNNNSNVMDGSENSHAMQEQNPHMMQVSAKKLKFNLLIYISLLILYIFLRKIIFLERGLMLKCNGKNCAINIVKIKRKKVRGRIALLLEAVIKFKDHLLRTIRLQDRLVYLLPCLVLIQV